MIAIRDKVILEVKDNNITLVDQASTGGLQSTSQMSQPGSFSLGSLNWELVLDPADATKDGSNIITAWTDSISSKTATSIAGSPTIATGLNSLPCVDSTDKNNRIVFPNCALGDFTVYMVFKCDGAPAGWVLGQASTGSGYSLTGFQILFSSTELRVDYRDGSARS